MNRNRNISSRSGLALLFVLLFLLSAMPGYAGFGKNKVSYYDYDWKVLKSEHINLHYYSDEYELALRVIAMAEESFDELSARMEYTPSSKIPIVLYCSHSEFAETNIAPYIIPEGVTGFTELFKNRVVLPFDGSYPRLKHVLTHEMVHYFTFTRLHQIYSSHDRHDYMAPPFWYSEGVAEYYSTEWNSNGEMTLADAIYNNYYVPLDDEAAMRGSYLAYKEGEAALHYLADTYGPDKVNDILELAWVSKKYREVMDFALPVSLSEFNQEFHSYLAKKYWPRLGERDPFELYATKVSSVPALRSGINWLDENRYVFLSTKDGYANLYLTELDELDTPKKTKKLVGGDRTPTFEDLYVFQNSVGTYDGNFVAFSAKSGARDHIYVYDVERGKTIEDYDFDGIVTITAPTFSLDGNTIAFRGLKRVGKADLFTVNRETGELSQITDDIYDQAYPAFCENGIVYCSDIDGELKRETYNLFLYDTENSEISQLTVGDQNDLYPHFSPEENSIYYTSDRSGQKDIYKLNLENHKSYRLTETLTGIIESAPRPGREDEMAFIALDKGSYDLFLAELDAEEIENETVTEMPFEPKLRLPDHNNLVFTRAKYRPKFALDFFTADVAYGPSYGTATGIVLVFTDMLNDHHFAVTFSDSASEMSEIISRIDGSLTYFNTHNRIGYGFTGFRFIKDANWYNDDYYTEAKSGIGGSVSYPLDRYNRIGIGVYGFNRELKDIYDVYVESNYKATASLGFTHDNSLWFADGPIAGERFNITGGNTFNLTGKQSEFFSTDVDLRLYTRVFRTHSFATRLLYMNNNGPDADPIYMGGSLSMRGYKYFDFAGTKLGLLNTEYRFSILHYSELQSPLGPIAFPMVRGCFIFDVGNCWEHKRDLNIDNWRGSFGFGIRIPLFGAFCLRTDHVWLTDFNSVGPFVPIRFYIGWSY